MATGNPSSPPVSIFQFPSDKLLLWITLIYVKELNHAIRKAPRLSRLSTRKALEGERSILLIPGSNTPVDGPVDTFSEADLEFPVEEESLARRIIARAIEGLPVPAEAASLRAGDWRLVIAYSQSKVLSF